MDLSKCSVPVTLINEIPSFPVMQVKLQLQMYKITFSIQTVSKCNITIAVLTVMAMLRNPSCCSLEVIHLVLTVILTTDNHAARRTLRK